MAMPYELSPQQHDAVTALDGPGRYTNFIGQIADTELVFGLRTEEGWVFACGENGVGGLPVWPHPDYALECATGNWQAPRLLKSTSTISSMTGCRQWRRRG